MMQNQKPESLETVQGAVVKDEDHNRNVQRFCVKLVHSSHCRNPNCRLFLCYNMRRILEHTKKCKKSVKGKCPICKPLIGFSCYHAKDCKREGCKVPCCKSIKKKLAEGQKINMIEQRTEDLELEDYEAPPGCSITNKRDSLLDGYHGAEYETTNGAPPCEKEWQTKLSSDLRNHLVEKLVKTQFPEPDTMRDPRFRDVLCFARKAESEMFEKANSREDYYFYVSDKIFETVKKLQDGKVAGGTASQDPFTTSHQK